MSERTKSNTEIYAGIQISNPRDCRSWPPRQKNSSSYSQSRSDEITSDNIKIKRAKIILCNAPHWPSPFPELSIAGRTLAAGEFRIPTDVGRDAARTLRLKSPLPGRCTSPVAAGQNNSSRSPIVAAAPGASLPRGHTHL